MTNLSTLTELPHKTALACIEKDRYKAYAKENPEGKTSPDGSKIIVPAGYVKAVKLQNLEREVEHRAHEARSTFKLLVD